MYFGQVLADVIGAGTAVDNHRPDLPPLPAGSRWQDATNAPAELYAAAPAAMVVDVLTPDPAWFAALGDAVLWFEEVAV